MDILHLSWTEVHAQARSFERGVSPLLLERMDARLGHPRTCPHGNPIPRASLDVSTYLHNQHSYRLLEASPGSVHQVLLVSKLVETSAALLALCAAAGLVPGAWITRAPGGEQGTVGVRTAEGVQHIAPTLAAHIWVTAPHQPG